jgi:hypothetical protein
VGKEGCGGRELVLGVVGRRGRRRRGRRVRVNRRREDSGRLKGM